MCQCKVFICAILVAATVGAQSINIRGTVSNQTGQPVSEAIVALLRQDVRDTTGSDGAYVITKNIVALLPSLAPHAERMTLTRGILELDLKNPSPVKVRIFDVKGTKIGGEALPNAPAGVYRLDITKTSYASNLLIVHASIGSREMIFRYFPLGGSHYVDNISPANGTTFPVRLAKINVVADTLLVTAPDYAPKAVAISSYDTTVNFTIDSAGAVLCEGCGKTEHPASGKKLTIDVEGTQREYLLKIPDNYEPNKQYKLVFCPHWLGGTIDDVVKGSMCGGPYYGLEKLANGTAIFVVPQGLKSGSNTGFSNTNGVDIIFFKAVLKYLNSTLCIDQKRIFSTGFSFGGMMSFAVGCGMNDVVRAIAPMSGAFYSGCDKTNPGPIAVWQAHGTKDQAVALKDATAARDYFLGVNGCSKETTPVDPSPCVAYKGCKEGYPYIYCEKAGGTHGVESYAAAAIWAFFSQF